MTATMYGRKVGGVVVPAREGDVIGVTPEELERGARIGALEEA
ncbi:hypothetical protein NQ034_02645 [Brevibacterium sp. 68QC2CO]|nr:hypothetical protein [Brevibacterium sp. 68QC2CO]